MTTNIRIEQVCSVNYHGPKIKVQAQELAREPGTPFAPHEYWRDSGDPVYLSSAFELTGYLMLHGYFHDTRRYVISEVR